LRRLAFSDAAIGDILEQFDWYAQKASRKLATHWESQVTSTLLRIVERPGTGSSCNFGAEQLAGTRRMPVQGFPRHLIFYQARQGEILILRIVHGARDLESLFTERRPTP
jgi:toxin ParE1/3/4